MIPVVRLESKFNLSSEAVQFDQISPFLRSNRHRERLLPSSFAAFSSVDARSHAEVDRALLKALGARDGDLHQTGSQRVQVKDLTAGPARRAALPVLT
jgi:hypothetical protein